ncbi:MAG: hypothetical protein N2544_12305 [Burkholderiales bacterium]|nr:hypothetical protein [Burkholderiales bacterium]
MSADEYQAGARRLTPAERVRAAEQIRLEREAAARAEREREAEAAATRRAAEAALAARPLGVRLVEARCGGCHARDYFERQRFGYAGWWATVVRMQVVNGAVLGPGERGPIVAHLAATYPASPVGEALEWALVGAVAIGSVAAPWWILRRRRRRGAPGEQLGALPATRGPQTFLGSSE